MGPSTDQLLNSGHIHSSCVVLPIYSAVVSHIDCTVRSSALTFRNLVKKLTLLCDVTLNTREKCIDKTDYETNFLGECLGPSLRTQKLLRNIG